MKQRFYLFRRCGTYYLQDARTKKQRSLETKDRSTAVRLLEIKRQADTAALTAENIDWTTNCISYSRMKTGEPAQSVAGRSLAASLRQLPDTGPLFPTLSRIPGSVRSAEFYHLCRKLKIKGVSLHSYRYAWAERAKTVGYPERFAQGALGHNSKAVHRAYAKRALMKLPSLEDYEQRATSANLTGC